MAEHMSKLHISSETATSPLEPDSVKNKRLYMCEELRKLQTDSLLPPSLLKQFNKPCTALVLWQPNPSIPKVSGKNFFYFKIFFCHTKSKLNILLAKIPN